MNASILTVQIVKILRVYFTLCLLFGIVASFFFDVGLEVVVLYLVFTSILIVAMTKILRSLKGDKLLKKLVYSFKFKDLVFFLFTRKKCPHCGEQKFVKHSHNIYKGRQRSTSINMNLMREDVYKSTLIYMCQTCKRQYTLQGLREGTEINEYDHDISPKNEMNEINRDTGTDVYKNKKLKFWMRKFINFWLFINLLILITTAIQDYNTQIIILFGPFILFGYFVFRLLLR